MSQPVRDSMAPVEAELEQERAFALGQAGKKVEAALADLATATSERAEDLLHDAATAVWHYLILRESLHMYDHKEVLELLGVPGRVRARIGVVRRR